MMTNKLFSLTGPSCGGKTTLIRQLLNTGVFCEVRSFTSRMPRNGEVHGIDYDFITRKEADLLIENNLVAESTNFKGNVYGITLDEINNKLASGKTPVVIVEPHGLVQLRAKYDCFSIYVDSNLQTLYERFLTRFAQNPNANVEYEAKRLMSINEELLEWRNRFSPNTWSMYLEEFNRQNEKDVVNLILKHAFSIT